jgi:uncharacterized protein YdhG (YjbR/CyaY superfamily)
MGAQKFSTVAEYIGAFPKGTQKILRQVRQCIKESAPEAEEKIAYNMPAFVLNGPLVYYAAFKNHIGFYANPTGHVKFAAELSRYKQGKGSVQFPLSEPMPLVLISRIVKFRVKENLAKVKTK